MISNSGASDDSLFVRTLHGGAGIPGSEVVVSGTGKIYQLGAQVGATGNVFALDDSAFGAPAVIKLFPRAAGLEAAAITAFAQTVLRAGKFAAVGIARAFDAGMLENGTPFVVYERLGGQTLKERLGQRVKFPPAEVLALLRAVGNALSAAHAAGLVHGELRPDNIVLCADAGGNAPAIRLLDFGVGFLTAPLRQMGINGSNEALSFLAPEQMQVQIAADDWDGRTDEYALAVLGHRLATGQMRRSPAFIAVLTMAMSQQPAERFETIDLFLTALAEVSGGAGTSPVAGAARRETLKPLPAVDAELTPVGSITPIPPMERRLPAGSSRDNARNYGALTQQFFEDGNRMSEEAAMASLETSEPSLRKLRVPTYRGRRVALALLLIVVAGGAFAVGRSGLWSSFLSVGSRAGDVFSAPRTSSASPSPAPAPVPVASTAAPASPAVVQPAAPLVTPSTVAAPAAAPLSKPAATNRYESPAAGAGKQAASEESMAPRNTLRARREPLRGYVWSPRAHGLVPADRAPGAFDTPALSPSTPPPSSSVAPPQWPVPPTRSSMPVPADDAPMPVLGR